MIKLGKKILKGVNWVQNDKIRSTGIERSKLNTQCKKSGHRVLKAVIWVHND